MAFKDYSLIPAENETLGDSIYIGPDMARNDVREAFQQLAADGRETYEQILDVDAGSGATGLARASSLTTLKAVAAPTVGMSRMLAQSGREGLFVVEEYDAAKVTADTAEGIHAHSTDDSTKMWTRRFDGWVNVRWFGAVGDAVTDDSAAFLAALAYLKAVAVNNGEPYYSGAKKLFIPAGRYYLGTTTLEITVTIVLEGESSINGFATRLEWADNTTGIIIAAFNTDGATGVNAAHRAGSYTVLRHLALVGGVHDTESGFSGSETENHGIHVRSNVIIEDCHVNGFRGDGIYSLAAAGSGGAGEGNSNCSFINRVKVTNVRNGLYLDGADANAWVCIGVVGLYCRQHTVWDSSFLGNTHIGHHSANAGLVTGVPASVVSYSGNRYCVRQGQAVGASTNAPSGTTAHNAWWLYISAGAASPSLNILSWTSGISVREGGGYRTDSANGYNTFIGCYQEGGEGLSQFVSPTVVMGGLIEPYTTGNVYAGNRLQAPQEADLGYTTVAGTSGGSSPNAATTILTAHNNSALGASIYVKLALAVGYETDGVTPCELAGIAAYGASSTPSTTAGNLTVWTREYSTGTKKDFFSFDANNDAIHPADSRICDLGLNNAAYKFRNGYFSGSVDAATSFKVNGTKVIGSQGAALPADATDLATALTLINAMKSRMVAHGLVA